ncbi:MAG: hypothetical protein RIR55_1478 [Bacteroidota bacterium]|jgi:hypothetical protein
MKFSEFKKAIFSNSGIRNGYFTKQFSITELIKRIKPSFDDFQQLQRFIQSYERELKSMKTLLDVALIGKNAFPHSFYDLCKESDQYFSNSVWSELNWQVSAFLKYSDKINLFLNYQNQFKQSLLTGEYEKARELLNTIENEVSVSYWSMENRYILDEYELGAEKNWETRNEILDRKNHPFVQAFGDIFSLKAEKRISFFQYNIEINNWMRGQSILGDPEYAALVEYIRFKSNYFSIENYQHFSYLMYKESESSMIDRYLMFKRICQHLLSVDSNLISKVSVLIEELVVKINDNSLNNLLYVYTDSDQDASFENDFLKVLDEYSIGNYKSVVELTGALITNRYASSIELYVLHAKSLIETNQDFAKIHENESISNQILSSFFKILNKTVDTDESLIELLKLSYVFNNSQVGLNLYSFVSHELGWENHINYHLIAALNSKMINPNLAAELVSNKSVCESFITKLKKTFPDSTTVKVYANYISNHFNDSEDNDYAGVPEIKNELYKLRNIMAKGRYEKSVPEYLSLTQIENHNVISNYEIVSNLFLSYVKLEDYRECVKLYASTFLKNNQLVKKMDSSSVVESIIKEKFKNVGDKKGLIEIPIFFKICCDDKIRVKQSYELFLRAHGKAKSSELIELNEEFTPTHFTYFLNSVCIPEILQLSKAFSSTYAVYQERIAICKFLTDFDKKNIDAYNLEIAELTQKNTISKVIASIDERKIYANESKLTKAIVATDRHSVLQREKLSPLNPESFDRYITLLNYLKNNNEYKDVSSILHFDDDGEISYEEAEEGKPLDTSDISVVLYLPAFRVFVNFFLHIRNVFVFDKEFGLDAYISTRIRHGTLPNHLRSVFESFSLVTSQTDGVYSENEYWKERINLNHDEFEQLQKYLSRFSKGIDDFSGIIKDEFVQCKSELKLTNELALLDFSYTEQELMFIFIEKFNEPLKLSTFIERVFSELWDKTEKCLEIIRKSFNEDYRDVYINMIEVLHSEAISIKSKNDVTELTNNLMQCKTEIQNKLNNISKWFRRSESSHEGEYKLEILAEASIEITKNIHPNYPFQIETEICENRTIKGEYHQHFIDLMNNCLFNIIKHSGLVPEELNARLVIQVEEDRLNMTFSNKVSNPKDHINKLEAIKNNWQNLDGNISEEGGTGFPKIKKIILSDMNRKFSDFKFNFVDNMLLIELSFETKDL